MHILMRGGREYELIYELFDRTNISVYDVASRKIK